MRCGRRDALHTGALLHSCHGASSGDSKYIDQMDVPDLWFFEPISSEDGDGALKWCKTLAVEVASFKSEHASGQGNAADRREKVGNPVPAQCRDTNQQRVCGLTWGPDCFFDIPAEVEPMPPTLPRDLGSLNSETHK
jgi:hypothetical protein